MFLIPIEEQLTHLSREQDPERRMESPLHSRERHHTQWEGRGTAEKQLISLVHIFELKEENLDVLVQ